MNAADFTIILEDEVRVMTNLMNELKTRTEEIKQSLAEGSEIRRDIKHGEEEMKKV